MGSPYQVHTHVNRTHVVKSSKGFLRIAKILIQSMGVTSVSVYSPEYRALVDVIKAYNKSAKFNQRVCVFLEARYEWTGWEKFQRVIIFDFSDVRAEQSLSAFDNSYLELKALIGLVDGDDDLPD